MTELAMFILALAPILLIGAVAGAVVLLAIEMMERLW
jgi:hypothetical protein